MEKVLISEMQIVKVIVHDVPKHRKDDFSHEIAYSEKESDLDDELKTFFRDKIVQAVDSKGFKAIWDINATSSIPRIVASLIEKPTKNFIQLSQDAAKFLYDIQKGINPGGIVVIIVGKINKANVISILKLERDEGAQLKKSVRDHSFNIVQVRDLLLTKKTRLYKVGIFFSRDYFECDFDGYVSDNQLTEDSKYGVAKFFLSEYLGCLLFGDNKKLTKEFFDISKEFIKRIEDPIDKAKYFDHLLSYSNRPNKIIDYKEFATYLEEEDRQDYVDFLKQNNYDYPPIQKDIDLIKSHISKVFIDFDNDISLIAKNGDIGNKVKLTDVENGYTKAEIIAKIKNVDS